MPTFRFSVRMGVTGSSTRGQWSNVFHIAVADVITADTVKTAADALVASLRHATLDSVTIYSVTIKDPSQDGHGYDASKVRSIPYSLAGQKVTGADAGEPKEVVLRFRGLCGSGRPGHFSLRMACLNTEVHAGGEGEPFAADAVAGGTDVVTALNSLIAAGTEFHAYSKLKSGAVSDRAITSYVVGTVASRTARRHHKRKNVGLFPKSWAKDAQEILKEALQLVGGYTVAKTVVPALESAPIGAAAEALGAAAGDLLPLLALL